jgi:ATP-binding cassette subfamily B protein
MVMIAHGMGRTEWGDQGQKPKVSLPVLLRMIGYFLPYKGLVALMVVSVLISSTLLLLPPLFTKFLIDDVLLAGGDYTLLLLLVSGMFAAPVVAGLFGVAQSYFNTLMVQRVMFDLRNELFSHLLDMSLSFFTRTRAGDILSRATNDVNGIQAVLNTSFTNVISNIITLATVLGLMFYMDWGLTLLILGVLPFFIAPTIKVSDLRLNAGRRVRVAMGDLTSVLSDKLNIGGIILVKTFNRQPEERESFSSKNSEVMKHQITEAMVGRWFFMIAQLFSAMGPAIIFGYGGWRVIDGALSLGDVVAFVAIMPRLFQPVAQLLNLQIDIAGSVALFERIFEYLDLPREIDDKPDALGLETVQGRIAFERVNFSYIEESSVLQDIEFTAEPGQMIALVGPSGAGKTSLAYLLMRMYDPVSGRITLDNHDLRNVTLASLGRHIGVVTQETNLFHTSVADNLRYADPRASDEDLKAACQAANIHQVIAEMPRGYETVVGERGYRLSGGEKQRLAIARLILKNPKVLILDEATSSLDTRSERLIQSSLDSLIKGRTSLVIAHRLSTILAADMIITLDRGRIVERGQHKQLLDNGGLYAKLYDEQFREQAEETETT